MVRPPFYSEKRSVAVVVRRPGAPHEVLAVRRPEGPGEELPGVWGLPAASQRPDESSEQAARRALREKLGLEVHALRPLAQGRQERPTYRLEMVLFEAEVEGEPRLPLPEAQQPGVTYYTAWRWAPREAFVEGAQCGSLCSQLYLQATEGP